MRSEPPQRPVEPTDEQLVLRVADGDRDSLGLLFDRHRCAVRELLAALGIPRADLDDLVQQTFLEVPRASARFDRRHSVRAWLLGIAAIMVRRHRRTMARWAAQAAAWAREWSLTGGCVAGDMIENEVGARRALGALDRLSPKKREVFLLVAVENASGAQAARALGIPLGTIWTRLRHARRELRRVW